MATATIPRGTKSEPDWPKLTDVPVDLVDVDDNVRADAGDVTELAESIKAHGVMQPITVALADGDRFTLVVGQRRLAAARLAGLKRIPAIFDPRGSKGTTSRRIRQLVENLQREDLNPLEEARAFRAILDANPKGMTQADLAREIGRSAPYVSNALRILELDKKVLPLVEKGQLTNAHAKALVGLKVTDQRRFAEDALARRMSAHELERQVQWHREREEREAEEIKKLGKWAAETEELLIAGGADKKTTTITTTDGYGYGPSEQGHKALKARGWKYSRSSWSKGKQCDCSAFGVDRDYQDQTVIRPRCVVEAHYAAKQKAAGKPVDRYKAQEEARQLSYHQAGLLRPLIRDAIAVEVRKLDPRIASLLLWSMLGYAASDWLKAHKGDRKKPDGWAELMELPSGDRVEEIVGRLLDNVAPRYGLHLDWSAIADAFGVSLDEPAKKGGEK